uniref:Uncharacterized protein n=1 Tax=Odontella aurita TaxID=265563 RepID=A0A7S4I6F9_9STRA|mmetsp:Transcript_206/g.495  ORF Transcript_206/g.495 Transcript_206/m.495 type:complete len:112 (+) Transcript_206:386-721(+)
MDVRDATHAQRDEDEWSFAVWRMGGIIAQGMDRRGGGGSEAPLQTCRRPTQSAVGYSGAGTYRRWRERQEKGRVLDRQRRKEEPAEEKHCQDREKLSGSSPRSLSLGIPRM